LRMRGVPVQHVEWLRRRFAGHRGYLAFDSFVSELFAITGGLDQGDPQSGFLYGIYNAELAEIPKRSRGEDSVVFVDDNTLVAVADDF
ncbi:hypothetical protein C8R45DRAFT_752900, partial [Mycena sanguinolenta]